MFPAPPNSDAKRVGERSMAIFDETAVRCYSNELLVRGILQPKHTHTITHTHIENRFEPFNETEISSIKNEFLKKWLNWIFLKCFEMLTVLGS